ncbi:MAG: fused MFS/spermidine synthase [Candidatus Anammoxibacter sp.]
MELNLKTKSGLPLNNGFIALLIFSVILIGLYTTIAQVLMFREFLVVFYGNELCIGIVFGTWLFGITIGAAIGGRISNKIATRTNYLNLFIYILLAMSLLLPLQVGFLRIFRSVLDIQAGQLVPILSLLSSAALIIIPFSITIGLIFPFACSILTGLTRERSTDIGSVYILEGIGALIGGVIFTFVLVSRVSSFEIMAILFTVMLITVLSLSFYLKATLFQYSFKICCLILAVSCLGLLLSGNILSIDNFFVKKRWESLNANIQLTESADSKYHNIVVGKNEGQYSVYVNGQYDFSFPDQYGYAQIAHLVMTQHPDPSRVLLIGGGLGGLINEILKHPVDALDYVELDPKLMQMTMKYLQPEDKKALSDKRVSTFNVDGRSFVKQARGKKYDLIFANTPDPSTALLNRFYTIEFFQEVKKCLKENGVFATHISSASNYMGKDVSNYAGSVYQTLTNTFPYVNISPGQTNYFFCSNHQNITTFDLDILTKRYKERNIRTNYFSEFNFHTILQPEQVTSVRNQFNDITNLRLNTDTRPITYFFNLVLWDQYTGGKLAGFFSQLKDVKLVWFLIPIFALLALRLIYLWLVKMLEKHSVTHEQQEYILARNSRIIRFNSLVAFFCIGFAGISVELIIIFAFQNIYGYIYERLGLIIALFMFGLAIGGFFANKLVVNYERRYTDNGKASQSNRESHQIIWTKVMLAVEISIVLFTLLLPYVLNQFLASWGNSQFIFLTLIITAGLLTGFGFPIGAKLYLQAGRSNANVTYTAGLIDSLDHLGALCGALLTGIIFVPLLGQNGTCIIVAMLNLSSVILLSHFLMQRKVSNLFFTE